jgi:hypothetical protein
MHRIGWWSSARAKSRILAASGRQQPGGDFGISSEKGQASMLSIENLQVAYGKVQALWG